LLEPDDQNQADDEKCRDQYRFKLQLFSLP
jgi:hypothetical protein